MANNKKKKTVPFVRLIPGLRVDKSYSAHKNTGLKTSLTDSICQLVFHHNSLLIRFLVLHKRTIHKMWTACYIDL